MGNPTKSTKATARTTTGITKTGMEGIMVETKEVTRVETMAIVARVMESPEGTISKMGTEMPMEMPMEVAITRELPKGS